MDDRERARRQQVAETKRRQRKFEERAKARETAEADMAKRVLQERKAKREAATKAIHEPSATPSPGVPSAGARFGLRKGSGVAGAFAFGRKGLPTRMNAPESASRERPATTAFGSRVRPSPPRDWSARTRNDVEAPMRRPSWSASEAFSSRDENAWPSSSRASKTNAPFERERPGDAAHRVRTFLRDRHLSSSRQSDESTSSIASKARRRPVGFAGSPKDAASPSAPWRLLKANAAADLGLMLGELEPERETKNEMETHSVMESDGEIDEAREERSVAARAAAAEAKAKAEATKATRAAFAHDDASGNRGGHLSSSRDASFLQIRPSSPVQDSAQPSPSTAHEDDDTVRTVRDSLEMDNLSVVEREVSSARVWREGDDVSGEDSDSENEAQTLAEARAAMAAAERTRDGPSKRPVNLNLFRDSLSEMPEGAGTTSEAVAELVSSVNGVLDSIDTFRFIECGVGENFAGRQIADMRTGRFTMQADETGVVPEFFIPEATASKTRAPETRAEISNKAVESPETGGGSGAPEAEAPTRENFESHAMVTPSVSAPAVHARAVPLSGNELYFNHTRAASAKPSPSSIPVATPVAVTREGAMRLVRAGIPLPDAYKAVLGEAPPRLAVALAANTSPEAEVAALPERPEAQAPNHPSAGAYFFAPRAAPPMLTAGGYAQKLEPKGPPSSSRRRASPTGSDRKKPRAVAERELKLEGSYTVAADEAASRRRREERRLAAIEMEAREARAEEVAAAARRARADSARDRHNTVFAPPMEYDRRGVSSHASRCDGLTPPPSTTPRALGAKVITPHGRRAATDMGSHRQTRVRFAETPEGRAARELLGGDRLGRAPLGERFVNRMTAGGRAPTSLSTEEAKIMASIKRLDSRCFEERRDEYGGYDGNGHGTSDKFASQRSVEEAALLASLARLEDELVSPLSAKTTAPRGSRPSSVATDPGFDTRGRRFQGFHDTRKTHHGRAFRDPHDPYEARDVQFASPVAFPAGVKPRPRRPTREPNRVPTRRWAPPDRETGPVHDEWGAPPPRREQEKGSAGRGGSVGRGVSASAKKRTHVGYVGDARNAPAHGSRHVRDSGGIISGNGRVTDYWG